MKLRKTELVHVYVLKQSVILKEKVVLYVFSLQNTNCNCINIYQSIEFVHAYVNKLDFF